MISSQSPFSNSGRNPRSLQKRLKSLFRFKGLKAIGYSYARKPGASEPLEEPTPPQVSETPPEVQESAPAAPDLSDPRRPKSDIEAAPNVQPPVVGGGNALSRMRARQASQGIMTQKNPAVGVREQAKKQAQEKVGASRTEAVKPTREAKPLEGKKEEKSDVRRVASEPGVYTVDEREIKGVGTDPKTGEQFRWKKRIGYLNVPTPTGNIKFITTSSRKRGFTFTETSPSREATTKPENRDPKWERLPILEPNKSDKYTHAAEKVKLEQRVEGKRESLVKETEALLANANRRIEQAKTDKKIDDAQRQRIIADAEREIQERLNYHVKTEAGLKKEAEQPVAKSTAEIKKRQKIKERRSSNERDTKNKIIDLKKRISLVQARTDLDDRQKRTAIVGLEADIDRTKKNYQKEIARIEKDEEKEVVAPKPKEPTGERQSYTRPIDVLKRIQELLRIDEDKAKKIFNSFVGTDYFRI